VLYYILIKNNNNNNVINQGNMTIIVPIEGVKLVRMRCARKKVSMPIFSDFFYHLPMQRPEIITNVTKKRKTYKVLTSEKHSTFLKLHGVQDIHDIGIITNVPNRKTTHMIDFILDKHLSRA